MKLILGYVLLGVFLLFVIFASITHLGTDYSILHKFKKK